MSVDPDKIVALKGVEGVFELDQDSTRELLKKWENEASDLAERHLSASIFLGRKSKIYGVVSVTLLLSGLTVSTFDPGNGILSGLIPSHQAALWLKDGLAWALGICGVILFFVTEGLEYPKRAALHNLSHKDFSILANEIQAFRVQKNFQRRDLQQVHSEYQKVIGRTQSIRSE